MHTRSKRNSPPLISLPGDVRWMDIEWEFDVRRVKLPPGWLNRQRKRLKRIALEIAVDLEAAALRDRKARAITELETDHTVNEKLAEGIVSAYLAMDLKLRRLRESLSTGK